MSAFDPREAARRRRPWDSLEKRVVELALRPGDAVPRKLLDGIRYVIGLARLTEVRTADGSDIEVAGRLADHAAAVREVLVPRLDGARDLWDVVRVLPDLVERTRVAREALLDGTIDRDSLEREITTRNLVVATGGGGGAGYVYLGAYQALDRHDLRPDLLVGTSIGALAALFRARRRVFDLAPLVSATQKLSWSDVLRVLEVESRYGLPATLRLYLRAALGDVFLTKDGRPLWLSDLAIPTYVIATGITVDALKHDLSFYEHFLDRDVRRSSTRDRLLGITRAAGIVREFLARQDALVELVLGRTPGTEDFDALDAAGFSAAVPGVLHYDVLRDDPRMRRILDDIYATYGITRLGEGGLVANVPARTGWRASVAGDLGVRQPFVLALDCFAPNPRRLAWLPLMQLVRTANVERDRRYADLYLPMTRTLSPANVVPAMRDAMLATRWGREALEPHIPFIKEMVRTIQVLPDQRPDPPSGP